MTKRVVVPELGTFSCALDDIDMKSIIAEQLFNPRELTLEDFHGSEIEYNNYLEGRRSIQRMEERFAISKKDDPPLET